MKYHINYESNYLEIKRLHRDLKHFRIKHEIYAPRDYTEGTATILFSTNSKRILHYLGFTEAEIIDAVEWQKIKRVPHRYKSKIDKLESMEIPF